MDLFETIGFFTKFVLFCSQLMFDIDHSIIFLLIFMVLVEGYFHFCGAIS